MPIDLSTQPRPLTEAILIDAQDQEPYYGEDGSLHGSDSSHSISTISRDPYSIEFNVDFKLIDFPPEGTDFSNFVDVKPTPAKKASKLTGVALGYVCLTLAVLFTGAQPVLYKYIPVRNPYLVLVWWYAIMLLLALPQYIHHIWTLTPELKAAYNANNIKWLAITCVSMCAWTFSWSVSIHMTTLTHVTLFSQLHPLMFVFIKAVRQRGLSVLELCGVVSGYAGVLVCLLGHSSRQPIAASHVTGDIVALLSTLGAMMYIIGGQHVRRDLPTIAFMLPYSILMVITTLTFYYGSVGSLPSLTTDAETGLFGLFNNPRLCALVVTLSLFSVFGIVTYTTSFKFVPKVVCSSAMLSEPLVATVLGIMIGVTGMPSAFTVLGGAMVLGGVGVVGIINHKEEVAKAALQMGKGTKMVEMQGKNVDDVL